MAKRKRTRRKRSTAEKVMLILGILIALSMILSLIVGLGSGGATHGNAPLPFDSWYQETAETTVPVPIGGLSMEAEQSAGTSALPEF